MNTTVYYTSRYGFLNDIFSVFGKNAEEMFDSGMNKNIISLLNWLAIEFFTMSEDEFKQKYLINDRIVNIKCDAAILLRFVKQSGRLPKGF